MYGLAPGVDLLFLEGACLIQVCVGENEVILNFDRDLSLMIATAVRVLDAAQEPREIEDARVVGRWAIDVLGDSIRKVHAQTDGTLTLDLASGRQLVVLDSSPDYESYTIKHANGIVVV